MAVRPIKVWNETSQSWEDVGIASPDPAFVQQAADAAQAAAEATAANALSTHESDTTNVHGIADTSLLETTSGAQAKADAAAAASVAKSVVTAKGDLIVASGSGAVDELAVGTNGYVLTADSTETLGMKWAEASGGISDGSLATRLIMLGAQERCNVVASAATGTVNFDTDTATVWYYTTNASANFTVNFRGDSSNTLSSRLAVGDSVTAVFINSVGTTPYHATAFQIDGSSVTPVWLNNSEPPSSLPTQSAAYIDTYTLTIIKTAATPTYKVLGAWSSYK